MWQLKLFGDDTDFLDTLTTPRRRKNKLQKDIFAATPPEDAADAGSPLSPTSPGARDTASSSPNQAVIRDRLDSDAPAPVAKRRVRVKKGSSLKRVGDDTATTTTPKIATSSTYFSPEERAAIPGLPTPTLSAQKAREHDSSDGNDHKDGGNGDGDGEPQTPAARIPRGPYSLHYETPESTPKS